MFLAESAKVEEAERAAKRVIALADLAALERHERQISQLRRTLQDQVDRGVPNPLLVIRERHVSAARRGIQERIDRLRSELEQS